MNVIIRQNGKTGSVEIQSLINAFFNSSVKGRSQNQSVVRLCVRDGV